MKEGASRDSSAASREQHRFYREVLEKLNACQMPYLIGGGYALEQYSEIIRDAKDLDLLVRPADAPILMKCLAEEGYRTELCFPHWLAKVVGKKYFVDIIFSSGNGVCAVDSSWFDHAASGEILGIHVKFCPAEELIWSKAFVMERERYDGADVAHIIRAWGERLDWRRLLQRFEAHWQVLLRHLFLFDFIYPSERSVVPTWVTRELLDRLQTEKGEPPSINHLCRGTLLSRSQYRTDLECWGYEDGRHLPSGSMTPEDAANWSAAAEDPRIKTVGARREAG